MWGVWHILFMLSPIVGIFILWILFRKCNERVKRFVGIGLSVFAIAVWVLRSVEVYLTTAEPLHYELIPLQICHLANFVLLFAFAAKNKYAFALLFTFFLPAAIMAIIFSNSLENFNEFNLRAFAYIAGHLLIVVTIVWAYISGFVKLNLKIFLWSFLIVFVSYLIILVVTNLVNLMHFYGAGANYFFVLRPESGTPLAWFFGIGSMITVGWFSFHPIYMVLTALFGLVIRGGLFGVYLLLEKLRPKKKEAACKNRRLPTEIEGCT